MELKREDFDKMKEDINELKTNVEVIKVGQSNTDEKLEDIKKSFEKYAEKKDKRD